MEKEKGTEGGREGEGATVRERERKKGKRMEGGQGSFKGVHSEYAQVLLSVAASEGISC